MLMLKFITIENILLLAIGIFCKIKLVEKEMTEIIE